MAKKGIALTEEHRKKISEAHLGNTYCKRLPGDIAAFNRLFGQYKSQAQKRGYVFELSREQFRELTKSACFYCNKPPSQIFKAYKTTYLYNGIDRIDNEIGYRLDNCTSCCKEHNSMKSTMTQEQFVASCMSVVDHLRQQAA